MVRPAPRLATASGPRLFSTALRSARPTSSRTALCADCSSTWLASTVPNRYCCGSSMRYWTFNETLTMFSSRVSTGTWIEKVLISVALTLVTDSIGQGNLKFGPGVRMRENWPKRSTTPRCCSPISWKLENSTSRTTAAATQRRMPPSNRSFSGPGNPPQPPPLPPPRDPNGPRRLSSGPCPPLLPPGVFQAMHAPSRCGLRRGPFPQRQP
ncbi:hypothetical protein D3C73_1137390 [compost metagenome]